MNKKMVYIAPCVEILNARVERGFEISGGTQNGSATTQQMNGGESYRWN